MIPGGRTTAYFNILKNGEAMITSKSNPKAKDIVKLRKSSKIREKTKSYIVEGARLVLEAPKEQVKDIFVTQAFLERHHRTTNTCQHIISSSQLVSDEVLSYVSDTKSPQGILAVVRQKDYSLESIIKGKNPLILLLESIQDPGNLGTIFRAAEAAGVTGIIMNSQCADIYNPKTIRGTMGSIYRIPFVTVEDLEKIVEPIKKSNIKIYATSLEKSSSYDKNNYQGGTAFIIGNEGSGLLDKTVKLADQRINIPMLGEVESLNVAVATTALLFEAARQRRN